MAYDQCIKYLTMANIMWDPKKKKKTIIDLSGYL